MHNVMHHRLERQGGDSRLFRGAVICGSSLPDMPPGRRHVSDGRPEARPSATRSLPGNCDLTAGCPAEGSMLAAEMARVRPVGRWVRQMLHDLSRRQRPGRRGLDSPNRRGPLFAECDRFKTCVDTWSRAPPLRPGGTPNQSGTCRLDSPFLFGYQTRPLLSPLTHINSFSRSRRPSRPSRQGSRRHDPSSRHPDSSSPIWILGATLMRPSRSVERRGRPFGNLGSQHPERSDTGRAALAEV